ncbi:MAG: nucleotidyltransferase family protein [Thermomicrobiales bacterium]
MVQIVHKVSPAVVRKRIHAAPEEIAAFCRAHHIRWLALFGSVLRDDFTDSSDIDVLVEFAPEHPVTFFDLYDMEEELSRLFGGRKIDLVTAASLHRLIRERVLPLVEVQYAER